jgi:glycosyltransferase involved in cell wall biosynthesis
MPPAGDIAILVSARRIASRERLFLRVADQLKARGYRVTFLAAGPEAELTAILRDSCALVDISPLPITIPHGLRMAAAIPKLAAYLRKAKPDVVFATSVPPNIVACMAGFAGRLVLRQSNALCIEREASLASVETRWRDRLIPRLYRRADAIIANSAGVAVNLEALGLDRRRIVAIPNGVECDRIETAARAPVALPWPESDHEPLIMAAGRLAPQKDHATLIRAFARLQVMVRSRLVILGEGPERRSLETLARNLGIGDRVVFPGYRENPYPLFARADLFVLSSRYEGMPNVLLEALACGLPIVSTDCPHGPVEILKDGWFGSLVPVGDSVRLAHEIARSLHAPANAERQRARARHFDAGKIAERYVDVLLNRTQENPARLAAE